ncbi:phosphotransferase family protein [Mycobacterium terramassiliense]|uniref:Predicted kinase, aminoglycoside phosphotransferase (APT) family n=1 Tax=Mycobacterium terramassiliense TaxID=1841859 RepID=A0A2U3NGA7_9MYCO|nr:phosphotransferase family protein [Mycobacterium terramassiliense]SPM30581.1 Predicted kinase, aminoglycoside phosphotransferase (APT) family [Mycobacterium terramassiliense]
MSEYTTFEQARPSASQRDPEHLRSRFQHWLHHRWPDAAVLDASVPSSNGMSSETVIVTTERGTQQHRLVVRIAPQPQSSTVFAHYDMHEQYRVLERLRAQLDPPAVPQVLWCEDHPDPMGAPFFVMDHVDGEIPADVMPYTFNSWLTAASPQQRQRLQHATIEQLARVHAAAPADFSFLDHRQSGETELQAHVRRTREYYDWARGDRPGVPLIEQGFDWLYENWPQQASSRPGRESGTVLSWGDARIGNIIYRDFVPVALLDWEMVSLGPRELDLGWMLFFHSFFEDIAHTAGLPGLPDLLRRVDVVEAYAELAGYRPAGLDFYIVYAALRQAIILVRIQLRAIAFGQAEVPDQPDNMIMHRETLARMLDGTYFREETDHYDS